MRGGRSSPGSSSSMSGWALGTLVVVVVLAFLVLLSWSSPEPPLTGGGLPLGGLSYDDGADGYDPATKPPPHSLTPPRIDPWKPDGTGGGGGGGGAGTTAGWSTSRLQCLIPATDREFPTTLAFNASAEFLFYYHIPKTGGMTLSPILTNLFQPPPAPDGRVQVQAAAARGRVRYDPIMFSRNPQAEPQRNESVQKLFSNTLWGLGHMDTSINDALETVRGRSGDVLHDDRLVIPITMMREPVHRQVSLYYFLKNGFWKRLAWEQFSQIRPAELTWEKFEEWRNYYGWNNLVTQTYVGSSRASLLPAAEQERRKGLADADQLAIAKENLRRMWWIGLTERYDESVELLFWTFGMTHKQSIQKRNVTPKYEFPSDAIAARLRQLDTLDIQLYDYAKSLFECRLAKMKAGASFRLDDCI